MRSNIATLFALPALTFAQQQIPLFDQAKNLYNKAASYVPGAAAAVANPVEAVSAKVAQHNVHQLTFSTWRDVVKHSGETWGDNAPENWMVYITGGNKTCGGKCGKNDKAWNESALLLQTDKTAPSLATIDCETEPLLCASWAAATGTIWFIQLPPTPSADQSPPPTLITVHRLNVSSATNADVTRIHTQKLYLEKEPMDGALHPFDGWVGGNPAIVVPLAYTLYYVGKVPSWAFMVGVTLFSRLFVGRRMSGPTPGSQRNAQGGGAAPAPGRAK